MKPEQFALTVHIKPILWKYFSYITNLNLKSNSDLRWLCDRPIIFFFTHFICSNIILSALSAAPHLCISSQYITLWEESPFSSMFIIQLIWQSIFSIKTKQSSQNEFFCFISSSEYWGHRYCLAWLFTLWLVRNMYFSCRFGWSAACTGSDLVENVPQITKRAETFNSCSFYISLITIISIRNGLIMMNFNEDVSRLYGNRFL